MKDLIRKVSKQVGRSKSGKQPVSTSSDVQDFLNQLETIPKSPRTTDQQAHLIFALDATASRQATWDRASQLQGEMFSSAQSLGGLQVQLCYFRGFGEFYSSEWHANPDKLLGQMSGLQLPGWNDPDRAAAGSRNRTK